MGEDFATGLQVWLSTWC